MTAKHEVKEAAVAKEHRTNLDKAVAAVKDAARNMTIREDVASGAEPATEDTFGLPPIDEIPRGPPPRDPNAPSLSLSADDEDAAPVEFTPKPKEEP